MNIRLHKFESRGRIFCTDHADGRTNWPSLKWPGNRSDGSRTSHLWYPCLGFVSHFLKDFKRSKTALNFVAPWGRTLREKVKRKRWRAGSGDLCDPASARARFDPAAGSWKGCALWPDQSRGAKVSGVSWPLGQRPIGTRPVSSNERRRCGRGAPNKRRSRLNTDFPPFICSLGLRGRRWGEMAACRRRCDRKKDRKEVFTFWFDPIFVWKGTLCKCLSLHQEVRF